jgi:nicotinate-nucleotide pyrophosphorylase
MNREDIVRMAKEAGMESFNICVELDDFAKLVASAEREACALMCEEFELLHVAEAIRYRGRA